MFGSQAFGPYQVGSTVGSENARKPHRDIDLRVMLPTKDFKKLQKIMNIDRFNLVMSLWGQKVTGMPIDFQVQDQDYANKHHSSKQGKLRSAVWIRGIAKGDGYDHKDPPQ
jgi:hypothetical protein